MGKLLVERIVIVLVSIATVCAVAVFATTLVHASIYYDNADEISVAVPASSAPSSAVSTSTSSKKSAFSARLIIPAINIDANVQNVGIGRSGNMAVPTNFTDVGWYRAGTIPGQIGSAVIDGHVDNGLGIDAVFKHITDLQPGDDIFVESASSTVHFVVTDVETYPAADVPLDLLFNRTDQARLNLITCAGTWIQDKKMYDERTVVYATLAQ